MIYLCYSTVSGNTKRLMEGVSEYLNEEKIPCSLVDLNTDDKPSLRSLQEAEMVVTAFWVYRSGPDPKSLSFLKTLEGVKVYLTGTLGYFADSPYGANCLKHAYEALPDGAIPLGGSLYNGGSARMKKDLRGEAQPPRKHPVGPEGLLRQKLLLERPSKAEIGLLAERILTQRALIKALEAEGLTSLPVNGTKQAGP